MSSNLNLELDEAVILKQDRIMHGGIMAGNTDTLILTNKRIIYIKKGIFGKEKGIESFLLANIKIYENRAQAVIGTSDNGRPTLEIYFNSNIESFGFELKRDVVVWIKKINELTTGIILKDEEIDKSNFFVPVMQTVANTIKTTLGIYKDALGAKEKEVEHVSCKCEGCGATIAGIKGETAKCPYCGNFITF